MCMRWFIVHTTPMFKAVTMLLFGLVGVIVPGRAVSGDNFLDKLKSATEKLQQLPVPQPAPAAPPSTGSAPRVPHTTPAPAPAQPSASQASSQEDLENALKSSAAPAEETAGSPERTMQIAKTLQKYDVLGITLGMPVKEAAAILQGRSLQLKPETIKYAVLPQPLIYGIHALNQVALRQSGLPPNAEKIYLMVTMPPNEPLVSRINRFLMFSKETAPTQQSLASDLIKKYGPVSYDAGPGALNPGGVRDMFWVEDAQGTRLKDLNPQEVNGILPNCRMLTSFRSSKQEVGNTPIGAYEIATDVNMVRLRLERGYKNQEYIGTCVGYTMIHARLFYAYPLGITSPDVVGALLIAIGNDQLDESATNATHKYLAEAVKLHEIKEKQGAQKNRPAL
jgi:hypothetical protein